MTAKLTQEQYKWFLANTSKSTSFSEMYLIAINKLKESANARRYFWNVDQESIEFAELCMNYWNSDYIEPKYYWRFKDNTFGDDAAYLNWDYVGQKYWLGDKYQDDNTEVWTQITEKEFDIWMNDSILRPDMFEKEPVDEKD